MSLTLTTVKPTPASGTVAIDYKSKWLHTAHLELWTMKFGNPNPWQYWLVLLGRGIKTTCPWCSYSYKEEQHDFDAHQYRMWPWLMPTCPNLDVAWVWSNEYLITSLVPVVPVPHKTDVQKPNMGGTRFFCGSNFEAGWLGLAPWYDAYSHRSLRIAIIYTFVHITSLRYCLGSIWVIVI